MTNDTAMVPAEGMDPPAAMDTEEGGDADSGETLDTMLTDQLELLHEHAMDVLATCTWRDERAGRLRVDHGMLQAGSQLLTLFSRHMNALVGLRGVQLKAMEAAARVRRRGRPATAATDAGA